jgi:DNA-binding PadR family transcriptional regulator
MTKLTPTSFALLTLIARHSQSAYELNKTMQNSVLRAYWPRAESHVYSEPKKLAAAGLVFCTEEKGDRGRARTIYHITETGRQALGDWLAERTETYASLQFEGMLKFICADLGDQEALSGNLEDIRERALLDSQAVLWGIEQARSVEIDSRINGMPFNAMAINFLIDLVELRLRWVEDALAALDEMPELGDYEARDKIGERYYAQAIGRAKGLLGNKSRVA